MWKSHHLNYKKIWNGLIIRGQNEWQGTREREGEREREGNEKKSSFKGILLLLAKRGGGKPAFSPWTSFPISDQRFEFLFLGREPTNEKIHGWLNFIKRVGLQLHSTLLFIPSRDTREKKYVLKRKCFIFFPCLHERTEDTWEWDANYYWNISHHGNRKVREREREIGTLPDTWRDWQSDALWYLHYTFYDFDE